MDFLKTFGQGTKIIGKDGKEYELTPLTFVDFAQFITWVKFKPYRDAVVADLPKDVKDDILEECKRGKVKETIEEDDGTIVEKEFDISLISTVVREQLVTTEGANKILEISFLIKNPNVNYREVIDWEQFDKIVKSLLKDNGLDQEEDEDTAKN